MTKTTLLACTALLLSAYCGASVAQEPASPSEDAPEGIPIASLISIVAEKSGESFLVDPRVRAQVTLIGQDPADVDYEDLLGILAVHGYAAMRVGDYVRIVPDGSIRQLPSPVVSERGSRADSEVISKVVTVTSMPGAMLVPVLRPLMPQFAHMAAVPCGINAIILVDTAANVSRIEALIESLDTGEPYEPRSCPPMSGGGGQERGAAPPSRGASPPSRGAAPPSRGAAPPSRGAAPPSRGAAPPQRP